MKQVLLLILSITLTASGCDYFSVSKEANNKETAATPISEQNNLISPFINPIKPPVNNDITKPAPTPVPNNSGVEGTVTYGPTCPVQHLPPEPTCEPRPYVVDIAIKSLDGKTTIAQTSSGADGRYKINVKPGSYLIQTVNLRGSIESLGEYSGKVTVFNNKFTHLDIEIDSGMR